jgi:hypothetical protein
MASDSYDRGTGQFDVREDTAGFIHRHRRDEALVEYGVHGYLKSDSEREAAYQLYLEGKRLGLYSVTLQILRRILYLRSAGRVDDLDDVIGLMTRMMRFV